MTSTDDDGVTGPARNAVWDAVLIQLSEHGEVEPQQVAAAVDADVTEDAVEQMLEDLADQGWLRQTHPSANIWLPGDRAHRLMQLPIRIEAVTRASRMKSTEGRALAIHHV